MNPWGAIIGAGVGLAASPIKHNQDMAAYNRNKEMQARLARWSPWSGIMPTAPGSAPSLFNTAMQGMTTGASMGSGMGGMMGGAEGAKDFISKSKYGPDMPAMSGGYEMSPMQRSKKSPWDYMDNANSYTALA